MDFAAHASSFGAAADLYDRIRPQYPVEALQWAVPGSSDIVDLGAGTGILTRQLRALGHHVIAVEPDDKMREQIDGDARAGNAAEIPVDDATQDAVTAGQAYHWFATEEAHTEIARVLKPGGCFVPIWNVRDESVPWVADLSGVFDGHRAREALDERFLPQSQFGPHFGTAELRKFSWSATHTADSLVELVRSRSYYLVSDEPTRRRLEQEVRALVKDHGDRFELPYVTYAYRARKL
ncbi:class I SAM-dependent methyltransferase [Dactylosporangium sp. AC04546]|uniref:class I SAM-dependent methyltransferase n=1 Tax=Dactylosporangium sp. AC04546 TaxID=2862460 RepID=UPI001EDCB9F6|nr:class I SAM-dependent methyltransferase [Dactylosporangium sp. AC04546]WVK84111.1 class I SAM-dependent methyltransferase [Dactylosporangium sp. AC04546]